MIIGLSLASSSGIACPTSSQEVTNIISKCGVGLIIVMIEHPSVWQLFPLLGITASYKVIADTP